MTPDELRQVDQRITDLCARLAEAERRLTIWDPPLSQEDRDALALHRAGWGAG